MPINPMNFLDFHEIFVNELFGNLYLFMAFILVVVLIISMRFRIPFEVSGLLAALFLLIVIYSYNITAFLTIIVFGIGVLFYFMYARKMGGS
jgi:hypothetical protein